MAIIVQFSEREASRYSRRFGETLHKEAEIVLFTGVHYEREDDELYVDVHTASEGRFKESLALIDCVEEEQSAG